MSTPRSAETSEGLLTNVASGYALAWTARRHLLAVLLPVVASMLLASSLLDVVLGGGRLVIVDGVVGALDADVLAWAKAATTASLWLLGLIAGSWAVSRGTGPVEALWHAVKHLPAFAVGLVAAAGCLWLALRAVAGVSLLLIVGVLVVAALAGARVLLTGIAWTIDGSDRMPSWGGAASFLLGGVAVPLLAGYARNGLGVPYVGVLVDAALLTVVSAVQVGLAARPHVPAEAPRHPARVWPGAAIAVTAALVAAGVVLVNPYAAPSVRTRGPGPSGAVAVAWPAGGHPVIVTIGGVWFCDDDLCGHITYANGGPPTIDGYGTAGIGADGTVVKTAVTGGPDKGGPFVHYARCVRDGCREAWLPVRATAADKLDREAGVEAAGAVAPDGALWLFVAAPVTGGELGRYRFSLIRCADVACAAPQRHQIGTVARSPRDGYPDGRRARLSIGADGRPAAAFWSGRSVYRYGCEPVTCAAPRGSATDAGPPDAVWAGAASYRAGELHDGPDSALIAGDAAARSGALAVSGDHVYVAAALPGAPTSGPHLTVGEPATYWRQTVWRCESLHCVSTPMDVYAGEARRELLAVAQDGRVLVVRDDRIVLLDKPSTGALP